MELSPLGAGENCGIDRQRQCGRRIFEAIGASHAPGGAAAVIVSKETQAQLLTWQLKDEAWQEVSHLPMEEAFRQRIRKSAQVGGDSQSAQEAWRRYGPVIRGLYKSGMTRFFHDLVAIGISPGRLENYLKEEGS